MTSRAFRGYWFSFPGSLAIHKSRFVPDDKLPPVSFCGLTGRRAVRATGDEDPSLRCKACLKVAARIRKAEKEKG